MADDKRLTGEDRQQLVAFLDNEIPADVAAMLEAKISGSVSARREVDELRQTWDLLDFLPMPEASNDFSQRTIECLAQADQSSGRRREDVLKALKYAGGVAAALAGMAAAFVGGYAAVSQAPDQNRRLIQDLPVLERFDEYYAVKDIEFLKLLRDLKTLDVIDEPFRPAEEAENK